MQIALLVIASLSSLAVILELDRIRRRPDPCPEAPAELATLVDAVNGLAPSVAMSVATVVTPPAAPPSLLDSRLRQRVVISIAGDADLAYSGALWEWDDTGVVLRAAEAHEGAAASVRIDGELFIPARRINVITLTGADA